MRGESKAQIPWLRIFVEGPHRPWCLYLVFLQVLTKYEADTEEREFLRAVVLGLMDLEEGRETDLDQVKARLGLV